MFKRCMPFLALSLMVLACGKAGMAQGPGADTYKAKCAMCHGADGMGQTPAGKMMKALPLDAPEIVKKSDATLITSTKAGVGKMPAFSGKLTDPEIKDVIAYIRTLQKK